MFRSTLNLLQLAVVLIHEKMVPHKDDVDFDDAAERLELFHFLKVAASEELDRIHSWDVEPPSPEDSESDVDEVEYSKVTSDTKLKLPGTGKSCKKTSRCKGIVRSDKINFARWRWGKHVLSKDGKVIATEEEVNGRPVLRSLHCQEFLVVRNTGRPSTMCRRCYEINRTLQYGLRDMKRGKLGKRKPSLDQMETIAGH